MKALIPMILLAGCAEPDAFMPDLCIECEQTCSVESLPSADSSHVEGAVYTDHPPAGGDHDPCWAPFGVHETEVNDYNFVHNLEHGAVVFLHNCLPGCAAEVAELESMASALPQGTWLVTPYAALDTKFGAVSWAWRFQTECFDAADMQSFYDEHVGNAPENVRSEPSESCM